MLPGKKARIAESSLKEMEQGALHDNNTDLLICFDDDKCNVIFLAYFTAEVFHC